MFDHKTQKMKEIRVTSQKWSYYKKLPLTEILSAAHRSCLCTEVKIWASVSQKRA